MKVPQSAEDKQFQAVKSRFEGKPGICGFFFHNKPTNDPNDLPETATIFPLTPPVNGKCFWACSRHSGSLTPAVGSIVAHSATLDTAVDAFPLSIVFTNTPPKPIVCPSTNELLSKSGLFSPDFAILESTSTPSIQGNHFWIPDPTPLAINETIVLFGNPGGTPTTKNLEAGLQFSNIFTYSHKSVSVGKVSHVSSTIVCHDTSTMGGFCGSVGVSVAKCTGQNFILIHFGTHDMTLREKLLGVPAKEHNHALSVNDPDFYAAYIEYIIPVLVAQKAILTSEQIATIKTYVDSGCVLFPFFACISHTYLHFRPAKTHNLF